MNYEDAKVVSDLNNQVREAGRLICRLECWPVGMIGRDRFAQLMGQPNWMVYRAGPWVEADAIMLDALTGPHGYAYYQAMKARLDIK